MNASLVRLLLLALLAVVALAGCAPTPESAGEATTGLPGTLVEVGSGSYREISVAELEVMLEDKDFVLINTHIPYQGDIPGTDASVPYNDVGGHLDRLPQERGAKIVVYCRTGPMSRAAARELVALGFTNVYDVVGGMAAWQSAGHELVGG